MFHLIPNLRNVGVPFKHREIFRGGTSDEHRSHGQGQGNAIARLKFQGRDSVEGIQSETLDQMSPAEFQPNFNDHVVNFDLKAASLLKQKPGQIETRKGQFQHALTAMRLRLSRHENYLVVLPLDDYLNAREIQGSHLHARL